MHLDLYRIADTAELEFLGLDDLAGQARCWLVEWPERGGAHCRPWTWDRLAVSGTGRHAGLRDAWPGTGMAGWTE